MANQIVWCDIPVKDLDRSIKFYSAVLGQKVSKETYGPMSIGLLPHVEKSVGGCLAVMEDAQPSASGPLIYLNCEGRLDDASAAAGKNGGKVLQPKHQIGQHGFRTIILDSEGNRVALHSM